MKLSKFCDESLVDFDLKAADKDAVIDELVELVSTSQMVKNKEQLLVDVKERENLVTTGVGYGVAFHTNNDSVRVERIFVGRIVWIIGTAKRLPGRC